MNIKNARKILHLYWRAGFGLSPSGLQKKANLSVEKEAQELVKNAKQVAKMEYFPAASLTEEDKDEMSKDKRDELKKQLRQMAVEANVNWVKTMSVSENPLLERMSLFWHGHFACEINNSMLIPTYMNGIRSNALGNFRELLLAVSKSPAMIRYLNNQQNRKQTPNENFAREVMELFTIGRDYYTESDIKAAARAFTGWASNLKGEFTFRQNWHDTGEKTFMGITGNLGGEDIINIILSRKETAHFIVTKIYKYFVHQNGEAKRVEELADYFYKNDYDIGKLMLKIFTSEWFYEDKNIGTKIKSPMDMLVGMMKVLDVEFEGNTAIVFTQRALGQILFDPPNVAGWAGGKAWIDNSTLMLRLNYASYLFSSMELDMRERTDLEAMNQNHISKRLVSTINTNKLVKVFKKYDADTLFENMKTYLILPNAAIDKAFIDKYATNTSKEDYIQSLTIQLMSLPEYQLC